MFNINKIINSLYGGFFVNRKCSYMIIERQFCFLKLLFAFFNYRHDKINAALQVA
jgi:hypothetical protein